MQLDLTRMSHSELKDSGNKFFAASDNKRAIECYSLAIKKNGSISTYYSNRALCYLQLKMYDLALADCRRALELDPNNLKAFFFAGQCHMAQEQYDEAVAKLTIAHSLALENHKNFGDDIAASIRLAKRKRVEQLDEKRRQEEIELQTYLNKLIVEDGERKLKALFNSNQSQQEDSGKAERAEEDEQKQSDSQPASGRTSPECDKAAGGGGGGGGGLPADVSIRPPQTASQIEAETASRLRELDALFSQATFIEMENCDDLPAFGLDHVVHWIMPVILPLPPFPKVDERRMKREIPDYLCGQISFELMQDPVITPSGITYDRRSIQAHLRQVGHFDPITRQPLTYDQLIPNLAMKEVVSKFLEENPWADGF
ncbi:unnamed protein product [Mesocestoides corti]|uniref:E3 ubiquitin-protein ligase CHIP n=1 Tax=Mesocestoides corti TaxID=53468 RepID=A0A0R3UF22_MESCO|nr:unnamed protein product [Mesocestoides corti]